MNSSTLADIVRLTLKERNIHSLTPLPLQPAQILRLTRLRERSAARSLQRAWRRRKTANIRLAVQNAVITGKAIKDELVRIRRQLEESAQRKCHLEVTSPSSPEYGLLEINRMQLFSARFRLEKPLRSPVALEEFLGRAKLRKEDVRFVHMQESILVVVSSRQGDFDVSEVLEIDRKFPTQVHEDLWELEIKDAIKQPFGNEIFDEISDSEAHAFVQKIQRRRLGVLSATEESESRILDSSVAAFNKLSVLGRRTRH